MLWGGGLNEIPEKEMREDVRTKKLFLNSLIKKKQSAHLPFHVSSLVLPVYSFCQHSEKQQVLTEILKQK